MKKTLDSLRVRAGVILAACALLLAGTAWADPPGRVVRLAYMNGPVSFLAAGDTEWVQAAINRPLWTGDRLWTGSGARAELQIGGAALRVAPETSITVINFDDRIAQFEVAQGAVQYRVRTIDSGDTIEIDTPNLAFSVQRPGEYRVDVTPDGDATSVAVFRGEAQAFGAQNAYVIAAGTRYRFRGTDLTDYVPEPIARRDALDTWAAERVGIEERSQSARYVSPDMIGYADLDANGTWSNDASYGPMLQSIGDTRQLLVTNAMLLATNLVLSYPFTLWFGFPGAAIATVCATVPPFVFTLWRISLGFDCPLVALGVWILRDYLPPSAGLRFGVGAAVYCVVFFVAARSLRLIGADDVDYLKRWLTLDLLRR